MNEILRGIGGARNWYVAHICETQRHLIKCWCVSNIIVPPVILWVLKSIFSLFGIKILIFFYFAAQLANLSYFGVSKRLFFITMFLNAVSWFLMGEASVFYALLNVDRVPVIFGHYWNITGGQ